MGSVNLDEAIDTCGGALKGKNDSSSEKKTLNFEDPNKFKIATYEAIQGTSGTGPNLKAADLTFRYTRILKPQSSETDKNGSTCNVKVNDPDNNRLVDFDNGEFGFLYDKTTTPRHHIVVAQLIEDQDFPAINEVLDESKILTVLFSGYNKTGAELNAGGGPGDRIKLTYTGIEQGINDLQVSGTIEWDLNSTITKSDNDAVGVPNASGRQNTRHTFAHKAIFNPDGKPNQMDFSKFTKKPFEPKLLDAFKGVELTQHKWFNNSGEGDVVLWSIGDVLLYVILWYVGKSSLLEDNVLPDIFDIKGKFSSYINTFLDIPSKLFDEFPTGLDLEGMGTWDAIVKTVNASRKFDLSICYDISGKAKMIIEPKKSADRDTKSFAVTVSRNDDGAAYDANKVLLNSTLFANREFSNLGRIIVIGNRVRMNTIVTTLSENRESGDVNYILSETEKPFKAITNEIDFTNRISLYPKNSLDEAGDNGVIYYVNPNTIGQVDIPLTLDELNNDDIYPLFRERLIFDHFEIPAIEDRLQLPFSEEHKENNNWGIYISDIFKTDNDITGDQRFIHLKPAGGSQLFDIQIAPQNSESGKINGAILVKERESNEQKDDEGDGEGDATAKDVENESNLLSSINKNNQIIKIAQNRNPLAIVARISFVTQYRIKGISKITGFEPKIHTTMIIRDDKFGLSLSFRDAKYNTTKDAKGRPKTNLGSFTDVPDGFIATINGAADPNKDKSLSAIQEASDNWLDKLVNIVQNSGSLSIKGIQPKYQVGKFIDEIEGGTRTIPFPSPINRIKYDYIKYRMFLTLGHMNEP